MLDVFPSLLSLHLVGGCWIKTHLVMWSSCANRGENMNKLLQISQKDWTDRSSEFRESSVRGRYLECPNPGIRVEVS